MLIDTVTGKRLETVAEERISKIKIKIGEQKLPRNRRNH
jgi:hypothetical protein